MKAALFIIDMQKAFFKNKNTFPVLSSAVEYINATVDLFNDHNLPVFMIQDLDAKEHGEKDYEVIDEITNEIANVYRIEKTKCNAFWETSLEEDLKKLGVDFVVITGFAAEACVNYTYNGARERGFHAVLLKNAVVSLTERYVRFVLETSNDISYFTLEYLLEE
jgi:nicotinamidase-related amidase